MRTKATTRMGTKTSTCLPGLVFLFLAFALNAPASPPAWGQRSLLDLVSTNEVVVAPEPAPPRQRAALDLLTEDIKSDTQETLPLTERRIMRFEPSEELADDVVDERVELARVRVVLEEVDALQRRQAHSEAIERLTHLLETVYYDLNRFAIYHRLGTIFFRLQDYDNAAVYMAQALAIQPNNAAMASNLAAAQMTLGNLDEALETLNSIQLGLITNRHLLFSIHFNLACLYSMKDQLEKAIEHLYQAAESDPPSVYASMGDPQLDAIRQDLRFRELQSALESMLGPR